MNAMNGGSTGIVENPNNIDRGGAVEAPKKKTRGPGKKTIQAMEEIESAASQAAGLSPSLTAEMSAMLNVVPAASTSVESPVTSPSALYSAPPLQSFSVETLPVEEERNGASSSYLVQLQRVQARRKEVHAAEEALKATGVPIETESGVDAGTLLFRAPKPNSPIALHFSAPKPQGSGPAAPPPPSTVEIFFRAAKPNIPIPLHFSAPKPNKHWTPLPPNSAKGEMEREVILLKAAVEAQALQKTELENEVTVLRTQVGAKDVEIAGFKEQLKQDGEANAAQVSQLENAVKEKVALNLQLEARMEEMETRLFESDRDLEWGVAQVREEMREAEMRTTEEKAKLRRRGDRLEEKVSGLEYTVSALKAEQANNVALAQDAEVKAADLEDRLTKVVQRGTSLEALLRSDLAALKAVALKAKMDARENQRKMDSLKHVSNRFGGLVVLKLRELVGVGAGR